MFTNLLSLFTTASLLFAGVSDALSLDRDVAPATAVSLATPALVTQFATLTITAVGGDGFQQLKVTGRSSRPNSTIGVRFYGDDTFVDDYLFSVLNLHTDSSGNFTAFKTVYGPLALNEDWEGTDEIYGIVDVPGGGTIRTNTISRSF